jgi:hypothetical protein
MSKLLCKCVEDIFEKYDYNNIPIKYNIFALHNNKENAWISIDKDVYSIRQDDYYLLNLFKEYYGQNVKLFLTQNIKNPRDKILILDKLKDRKIGNLID